MAGTDKIPVVSSSGVQTWKTVQELAGEISGMVADQNAYEGIGVSVLPADSEASLSDKVVTSEGKLLSLSQMAAVLGGGGGTTGTESVNWGSIADIPDTFPPADHTHAIEDVEGLRLELDALAAGSTNGTPGVIIVDNLTSTSATDVLSANQGRELKALVDGKAQAAHNHDAAYDAAGAAAAVQAALTEHAGATADAHAMSAITGLVAALAAKASASDVTTALAEKAPLASPALTGVPTAPTAAAGTNTVQVATTEFVQDAIATVGGGGSNPNILINTDGKNPINQREVSGALAGGVYGFDRWVVVTACAHSATGNGFRNAFTVANSATSYGHCQRVENPTRYSGRQMTLSAKVKASAGSSGSLCLATEAGVFVSASFAADGNWHEISCTGVPYPVTALFVCTGLTNHAAGDYVEVEWMKLEEGAVATQWKVPDPQQEPARCQRYCRIIGKGEFTLIEGYAGLAGIYYRVMLSITPMRTTPTAAWVGTWNYTNTNAANRQLSASNATKGTIVIGFVTTGAGQIQLWNNPDGAIILDAEL